MMFHEGSGIQIIADNGQSLTERVSPKLTSCCQQEDAKRGQSFKILEGLVERALMQEVLLAPKPGLVDVLNNGAHTDMNLLTFAHSAKAITPFMPCFAQMGYQGRLLPPSHMLTLIRPLGLACEQAMFQATQGINTHKGAIFSFSLLCTAIGYLSQRIEPSLNALQLCHTVASFCEGIVDKELRQSCKKETAGYRAYQRYGLTGARGEAESGFATVLRIGLPLYDQLMNLSIDAELVQLHVLMNYLAHNQDTNLVARGGIKGLQQAQQIAKDYLHEGSVFADHDLKKLQKIDQLFISYRWSPGGSADLLAMTVFLYELQKMGMT